MTSCPATENELKHASSKKHCEVLANIQSCTKPETFRYHCVLNSWNNSTVEVCAPEILSQGKMSTLRLLKRVCDCKKKNYKRMTLEEKFSYGSVIQHK